jgi:hypothetical protein
MPLHFCTNRFDAETVTRPRRPWHQFAIKSMDVIYHSITIVTREIFMTPYDGGNDDGEPSESDTVVWRMCYSERVNVTHGTFTYIAKGATCELQITFGARRTSPIGI